MMNIEKNLNILITNIGRRGYLVGFFKSNTSGNVYVSDCDYTASGLYGANDGYYILPKPVDDEKKYVNNLIELCLAKGINIIVPVIDPEIYILSKYKHLFKKEKILVLVSNKEVLEICYSKKNMNSFLKKSGFEVIPSYYSIDEFLYEFNSSNIDFPVFLKPEYGSGSINSIKIETVEALKFLYKEGMIIQKYIDGQEYGIDIFNDQNMKPIRVVIKKKISMRSGETDKAITVCDDDIFNVAIELGEKLGHFGPLDCDIFRCKEKIYILDLNPRFGGGYPFTHLAGVDFTKLILRMYNDEQIIPQFNNYPPNKLCMKTIGLKTIDLGEKND